MRETHTIVTNVIHDLFLNLTQSLWCIHLTKKKNCGYFRTMTATSAFDELHCQETQQPRLPGQERLFFPPVRSDSCFALFFFSPLHVLFELILENGLLSSLKFKPLQSSKVSTQRRPGSISSALFCFMKKKESKICGCLCVCVCVKPHTCAFLQACRWAQRHAPCRIVPSQVGVWVSELSFKSDSNYPESKPCMLFISIPVFFMPAHNFCARFSKDVL